MKNCENTTGRTCSTAGAERFFLAFVLASLVLAGIASAAPSVLNVAGVDGYYNLSKVLNISVTYNETVLVNSGTPTLQLNTGDPNRNATWDGGSSSATLYFIYTVQAGDTAADLDYATVDSLVGDIRAASGAHPLADNTLATPGDPGSLSDNNNTSD